MRKRNEARRRGRPPKLSAAQELAIFEAREVGVCWKDLIGQYGASRSALAEAYRRAQVRISGHLSRISGHLDAGQESPA